MKSSCFTKNREIKNFTLKYSGHMVHTHTLCMHIYCMYICILVCMHNMTCTNPIRIHAWMTVYVLRMYGSTKCTTYIRTQVYMYTCIEVYMYNMYYVHTSMYNMNICMYICMHDYTIILCIPLHIMKLPLHPVV